MRVRDLTIDPWYAASFDLLASFQNLQALPGESPHRSAPSLDSLRHLPELEVFRVEAHDPDFTAIGDVPTPWELHPRVPLAVIAGSSELRTEWQTNALVSAELLAHCEALATVSGCACTPSTRASQWSQPAQDRVRS